MFAENEFGAYMHLYLSSYRLGNERAKLVEVAHATKKAAVIANALDHSKELERKAAGTLREIRELEQLGFEASEVDLREFFGRPELLRQRLANVGLLWVVGGNSFLLRRAFKQSGLDEYLLSLRGDDSLVYAGYSAGAVVVTPTLRGIEFADPPDLIADGYDPEVLWDGLGLVPFSIAPHYRSEHPDSGLSERCVEYFVAHEMPFRPLRDGQVIVTKAVPPM